MNQHLNPLHKPWYKGAAAFVAMALFIGVWVVGGNWAWDKAFGEEGTAQVQMACDSEDGTPCKGEWSKKKAKQFRNDKLGNSKGYRFPKKIRRMAKNWYENHPNARMAMDGGDWWRFAWTPFRCLTGSSSPYNYACRADTKASEQVHEDMRKTNRIVFVCGGAAMFGATRGGGWWGAGLGGGSCLWAEFWNKVWG